MSALTVVGGGFICVFAFIKVAFTGTGPIDRRALHLLALTGIAVPAAGRSRRCWRPGRISTPPT